MDSTKFNLPRQASEKQSAWAAADRSLDYNSAYAYRAEGAMMGREVKRVPLDFKWPLRKVWSGYVNPYADASARCPCCQGSGYSPEAARLSDRWYGTAPFHPSETGSELFSEQTPQVVAFARRNVETSPSFYGSDADALSRESARLSKHWNKAWGHHLSQEDVEALWVEDRLRDFDQRASLSDPRPPAPPAREVNLWSLGGLGHDSINQGICVRAACERRGEPLYCSRCEGEGSVWMSEADRLEYEQWSPAEPPVGIAYQLWETVSEGSPVSPAFARPEDLARWLASEDGDRGEGVSYVKWLAFIQGPGWAPSLVINSRGVLFGVDGV